MDNKILITGSRGFVGKNFYQALAKTFLVYGLDRSAGLGVDAVVDMRDAERFSEILGQVKPSVIIHCAAYSNVDGAEVNREEARQNNVTAVETLADWARGNQAKLIFISSDYVYDGSKGNFTEDDAINPLQYYGQTKVLGEEIVSKVRGFVILRPTVIYGWEEQGKNFFMQLYRRMQAHEPMAVPTDQISNPTSVIDLSQLMVKIVSQPEVSGAFVATGPEAISRYEFASRICDYQGWDKSLLVPKTTAQIGQSAPRPLNNSTSSKRVCQVYNFQFRALEQNLNDIKEKMKL